LLAAEESDHGLEGDPHLVSRGTSALTAGFDLRVVGDGSGNRVGQLTGEPVDVIHGRSLLAAGTYTGAFPSFYRRASMTGRWLAPACPDCQVCDKPKTGIILRARLIRVKKPPPSQRASSDFR